jgi:hypothetical protein
LKNFRSFVLEPLEEFDNFVQEAITNMEGMGDSVIEDMESLGLLGRSSMVAFHRNEHGTIKDIGGYRRKVLVIDEALPSSHQTYVTGIPFAKPAEELRSIISLEPNDGYFDALRKFVQEHVGIELQPIPNDLDR